jgi:hypothetical protein
MIDYIKNIFLKKFPTLSLEKMKPLALISVCFIAVFIAGVGVGSKFENRSTNINYTTKTEPTVKAPAPEKIPTSGDCKIKGSKSKIYHMQGGSFYNRTNAAECFDTEEAAVAAGYTKSSR